MLPLHRQVHLIETQSEELTANLVREVKGSLWTRITRKFRKPSFAPVSMISIGT